MLKAAIHRNPGEPFFEGAPREDVTLVLIGPVGPIYSHGGLCSQAGAQHLVDELEASCRRMGMEVEILNGVEPWRVSHGPIPESWERVGMVGDDDTGYVEVSLPPNDLSGVAVHIGALGQDAACITPDHAEVLGDHLHRAARTMRQRHTEVKT